MPKGLYPSLLDFEGNVMWGHMFMHHWLWLPIKLLVLTSRNGILDWISYQLETVAVFPIHGHTVVAG